MRTAWAAAAILTLVGGGPCQAGDGKDHNRARQAVDAGEVLPLHRILKRVEHEYPGQVMDVELDREGERWIYEIKVLRAGGSLVKLKVDARDGTVLDSKRHDGGQGPAGEHR